jgi:hypothetical protein
MVSIVVHQIQIPSMQMMFMFFLRMRSNRINTFFLYLNEKKSENYEKPWILEIHQVRLNLCHDLFLLGDALRKLQNFYSLLILLQRLDYPPNGGNAKTVQILRKK